ncbi:MAG: hypothetical protein IT580_23560, partial [Verrucomicrobiales bacterium]|nr:hypothetical protein [Verrucomicrobiales bacterium]
EEIVLESRLEAEAEAKRTALLAATQEAERKERSRLEGLTPEDRAMEAMLKLNDEAFALAAKTLGSRDEIEQRALLRLLGEHKDKRERWKTWKKKKPELAASLESLRQKLNAPPLP